MTTDPWCKKCPMFLECIEMTIIPRTLCCDAIRMGQGHLTYEDINRKYPDPMEVLIRIFDCF